MDDRQDNAALTQGSDEWHRARLGKVTASNLVNVMMKDTAAGYTKYLATLACERMTGTWEEGYKSFEMQRGKDQEADARTLYELNNAVTIEQVGFADHPTIKNTGASPDGYVRKDGGVEIKCVDPHTHYFYMNCGQAVGRKYNLQMLWEMECGQRKWCDFVSYCPQYPMRMRLHVTRIMFDEVAAQEARKAVMQFLAKVDARVADLEARFPE